jgi:SpoVK/Ycf46/Vps4 family AAA+-type ATPase
MKVILPLKNPDAFEGYVKRNGGGLLLYGPPGTGKTMIAAAIANEIGAKFCSVKPSDLLHQGAGQSEKAVRALFAQARRFPCAVIYFDEMDSISPKNTRSQYAKQLRSEFLAQLQGIESYGKDTGNILFLIAATNKPWDIDSAFIRPGRFGTRIYVGLPDDHARSYIIESRLAKLVAQGIVAVSPDIPYEEIVDKTEGFNCSDITNLLDEVEEISMLRSLKTGVKCVLPEDFDAAFLKVRSSVQREDIERLREWTSENN